MDVEGWLASACADADRRGLPQLKPLLEALARSLQALRDADAQFLETETPTLPDAAE